MKFGIQTRLFVAIIGAIAVVAIAMALAVNWSFERGFVNYLRQVEMERLAPLLLALGESYGQHGNWDFLRHRHRAWQQLLRQSLGEEEAKVSVAQEAFPRFPRPPPPFLGAPPEPGWRPPPPPAGEGRGGALALWSRLRLLDVGQRVVFGPPGAVGNEMLRPIVWQGATVGYLAVRGSEIHIDTLAEAFQSGQRQTYGLIAALVVLLSSLSSLYLARRLLRPIRWLADGAQALAAGDYDTRIEVERDDELGRLARHFNHLAAALARNEQLRRQWIADISHELRTPLAVLRGEIEALQDGVRAVSAQRLNSLHAEALALGQLVEDLYQLALADAGALEYRCESVDLAEILTDTAQAFRHRFEQQGLTLDNQVAAPLWLHGDPLRLQQLFSNLLENSQRYTAAGGRLEIVLERSVERHVLVFRDSAPAVPDAALSHLFERLYRVDKSRSRSLGGAGLGLALCQNIVEAHGGRMTASHSPLGGLQVRVELPVQGAGFERRSR